MPKTPKSPLEKPSSGHTRRPSGPRRTSSNEKAPIYSSSSKHGVRGIASGHASARKTQSTMLVSSTAAKGPDIGRRDPDVDEKRSKTEARPEKTTTALASTSQYAHEVFEALSDERKTEELELARLSIGPDGGPGRVSENIDPEKNITEEVDRLKAAVNAQISLTRQREKLAKQLGERERQGSITSLAAHSGKSKVSPINEETPGSPSVDSGFASPLTQAVETTSTESGKTIRGDLTPSTYATRTPSYPFPPMKSPRQLSFGSHHPFTALSPTVAPEYFPGNPPDTPHDRWMSGSVTPASAVPFQPAESPQIREDLNYPSPNLYELSLMLSSEPGLDAWWTNVVQIMRDVFKADRVTLAVPADSTDIENVPWGQKATFNTVDADNLSMGYLPRGSSLVPSSQGDASFASNSGSASINLTNDPHPVSFAPQQTVRPALKSRHSFTAYEETKRVPASQQDIVQSAGSRPTIAPRSKSYLHPTMESAAQTAAMQNVARDLQSIDNSMDIAAEKMSGWANVDVPHIDVCGRVFPVLQALDYEADPLIDSSGVIRVLQRGKVIALTRDYPYLHNPETIARDASSSAEKKSPRDSSSGRGKKPKTSEVIQRMSNIFGGGSASTQHPIRSHLGQASDPVKPTVQAVQSLDDTSPLPSPRYEEYEQFPPSPWSQSPTPSPAVRSEPSENPFFAVAEVNEESFNPTPAVLNYAGAQSVEAIGVDRSYTVLHVPLNHPTLSKPVQSFRLDTAALEYRSIQNSKEMPEPFIGTPKSHGKAPAHEKPTPIAILSIISSVIPYPTNLRHSLEHLSPHLATSFSLCQHYSNLEAEIAGLQRKRPHMAGFGAVVRPPDNLLTSTYSPSEDEPRQASAGSVTSPSDYSGLSRSNAGSPAGTPGWEPTNIGLAVDRRSVGVSPIYSGGFNEGYFSSRTKANPSRVDTGSGTSAAGGYRSSKSSSPSETRQFLRSKVEEPTTKERGRSVNDRCEAIEALNNMSSEQEGHRNIQLAVSQPKQVRIDRLSRANTLGPQEVGDLSQAGTATELPTSTRPEFIRGTSTQAQARTEHTHTKLHTGGVDLGSTFPSLPSRSSNSGLVEMLPPSDRLKTLMLDTLPCHVFVALPVTGEIVWINNRYLSYRGQTIPQLRNDPWGSIHPEEREEYLRSWSESIRTGRPFSKQVRIRRFDGSYRWFFTRAVAGKDTKNVIVQWYGSHMDIHDQHEAEVKAARQEESEASEANYRLLANLIPQIIFAASEEKGIIFANEQWLTYTGQGYEEALELGFMDFVHPDDLAKCRIPFGLSSSAETTKKRGQPEGSGSQSSPGGKSSFTDTKSSRPDSETPTEATIKENMKKNEPSLSRTNSSCSESRSELSTADISALTKSGVVQVTVDSNGRQSYTTEVRLRSKKGEYRWHLVRCVEVDNFKFGGDGGGHGSWFGACTDINDHKLLETKLKEAMDSKSKFLSNMSHEIRTPLIGISGMVSFLQDTVLNEEQLDYTNTIQTSANSLLSIINDILDLSKVDAGMMKLSYEWFHARSVIEEVNELVSTMAISKRLELNYVVDEDVPAMVKGDKIRIRQVLLNVIGNAIKFTTEGEVFSTCRVYHNDSVPVAENEIMLEFSIVDTGRGFTKEEAELIFKPFSQIDGSSTRQHGGSGLGLVISRQLVELHGGKMEGSAVPGKGSTFTFTAKFGLPTETDHPEPRSTSQLSKNLSFRSTASFEGSSRAMKLAGDSVISHRYLTSPSPISPKTDPSLDSPAVASSASSDPSIRSVRSYMTGRSSASSINPGLANFSEAARASGQDLLNMKLAIPPKLSSDTTPTQESISPMRTESGSTGSEPKNFRPPMYSILIVCPQTHSREATTKHIEQTLPKVVPYQITTSASVIESQKMIGGDDPLIFTHIVLNLGSPDEIIALMDQIFGTPSLPQTSVVILSDPVQRQAVIRQAPQYDYDQLAKENRVTFIYKPVKPSRFAVIFDPDKERDLSTDRNRSSAQQQVANQKQNYLDVGAKLGNKGYKVLVVEDNLVNQKVLLKYLTKVGIEVEIAYDGVECTEKVFSRIHNYYSLILCDLHMPRKDGYQTCREIRTWEKVNKFPLMPIIALSANVMAEVIEKCVAAGFNSYVTKPVDFKMLSSEMARFLDREDPTKPHELMRAKV